MTTYLGKSCSFCLPRVPFVNCRQFMYLDISLFGFEGRIWDLIVSVPDHCLSFYFVWCLSGKYTFPQVYYPFCFVIQGYIPLKQKITKAICGVYSSRPNI